MIIDYIEENNKSIIHFWKRVNGIKVYEKIEDFKPYFYVLKSEIEIAKKIKKIIKIEEGYKSLFNEDVIKVYTNLQKDVWEIIKEFSKTYEADINLSNRWLIDSEQNFGDLPLFLFYDIEIITPNNEFPNPETAEFPITSITFTTNLKDKYVTIYLGKENKKEEIKRINRITKKEEPWIKISVINEKLLFEVFLKYVKKIDPDGISGWNTDFFDTPYIINRMNNIGLNANIVSPLNKAFVPKNVKRIATGNIEKSVPIIKGINIFDLLIPFKKMNIGELESNALGNVGKKVLGIDKIKYKGTLKELYENNLDEFLNYNCCDVELVKEIDKKLRIIKYFFELSKFIGCKIGDTMSNSRMGDIYVLRYNKHTRKVALPSKSPTVPQTFEGAKVFPPEKGLLKNVIVLDLKRIYPSIIISCNLSPETYLEENSVEDKSNYIQIGNGLLFKKEIGFSTEVLKKLFQIRDEKKKVKEQFSRENPEWEVAKREEQFVKDLINSYYGLLSYKGFRLYVPNVGATVTYMGRKIISWSKEKLEEKGYKIVYGDTDSLFVQAKEESTEFIIDEGYNLSEYLTESYNDFSKMHNIDKHYFQIEFEKTYKNIFFFGKKKKYAGILNFFVGKNMYKGGELVNLLEMKGMESVRSDSSLFTKIMLKELIEKILREETEIEIKKYVNEKKEEIRKINLDFIGIPKGINQELEEYKTISAFIRACRYSNKFLGKNYQKGSKPKMMYIKKVANKYDNTDVLAFDDPEDIPVGFEVDYRVMYEKLIKMKIERIFECLNWKYDILYENNQKSLIGY